jgi:hypothetical protein
MDRLTFDPAVYEGDPFLKNFLTSLSPSTEDMFIQLGEIDINILSILGHLTFFVCLGFWEQNLSKAHNVLLFAHKVS